MKRFFLPLFVVALTSTVLTAGERSNTVLIHPGEVIYARFTAKGKKLTLVSTAKEKDDQAQLILTMSPVTKHGPFSLKVENNLPKDLIYQAEVRSLTLHRHMEAPVVPVVTGKMAIEQFPPGVEEVALFGFKLDL